MDFLMAADFERYRNHPFSFNYIFSEETSQYSNIHKIVLVNKDGILKIIF